MLRYWYTQYSGKAARLYDQRNSSHTSHSDLTQTVHIYHDANHNYTGHTPVLAAPTVVNNQ